MTDPAQLADLAINQPDVALIFEGGGMRNSYTAPMVVELLARNLNFGCVYGISAGSSHTVNYLVRDATRARASFVDLVKYPRFGGWGSFLRGTGYFNSPYLYEELIENAPAGDPMAFDWDTFAANPANMHIEAMDWDTGETVAWTRADGYERFCIIRTQPRGYRKHAMSRGAQALFRSAFRKHPIVAERTIARWQPYNELCDEIEQLEKTGAAWVFYPDTMDVTNKTTDYDALVRSYETGLAQAQRDIASLLEWLG